MIGVDTNVLVRFFTQDDERQARLANAFMRTLTPEDQGFVSQVVLAELVWVLDRSYRVDPETISDVVMRLLGAREIAVEGSESVRRALAASRDTGADFVDALIATIARREGCAELVTFDRGAARLGMRLLG